MNAMKGTDLAAEGESILAPPFPPRLELRLGG